jgi:hypothetical protein
MKMQDVVKIFAMACVLASASAANGESLDLRLPPAVSPVSEASSFRLAVNDVEMNKVKANLTERPATSEFNPPAFSASNAHKFLGLGTVVMAGLTALTHPEECESNCGTSTAPRETNGTHAQLAKATVALAAATVVSGLYAHWDDFSLEDGWSDPDNLHVLLAVTGAALMAYAVNKSASSSVPVSHAGVAELGALSMVVAIKLTW